MLLRMPTPAVQFAFAPAGPLGASARCAPSISHATTEIAARSGAQGWGHSVRRPEMSPRRRRNDPVIFQNLNREVSAVPAGRERYMYWLNARAAEGPGRPGYAAAPPHPTCSTSHAPRRNQMRQLVGHLRQYRLLVGVTANTNMKRPRHLHGLRSGNHIASALSRPARRFDPRGGTR